MTALAGPSIIDTNEIKARAPKAWAKVTTAENYLLGRRWHFCCRHVLKGDIRLFVAICTDHLGAGLFCEPCIREHHVPRHSDAEEHTCDECRRQSDRLRPVTCITVMAGIKIREPRGQRGVLSGPVAFIGSGCCPTCWGAP